MDAASEIAVAKDNVAEASGSAFMCAMSGGDKSKSNAKCGYCNSESHNANGFTTGARQKFVRPLENIVTNVVLTIIFLLHAGQTK